VNILHATTDPTLLTRLKQMLDSAERADLAVGYLFVPGFNAVAEELGRLEKVRILVGRLDRHTLEEVALGVQQAEALQACPDGDRPARRDVEALADPTTPSQRSRHLSPHHRTPDRRRAPVSPLAAPPPSAASAPRPPAPAEGDYTERLGDSLTTRRPTYTQPNDGQPDPVPAA